MVFWKPANIRNLILIHHSLIEGNDSMEATLPTIACLIKTVSNEGHQDMHRFFAKYFHYQ